jgi:hypothetical protein
MPSALPATISVVGGAIIAALASVAAVYFQRTSVLRNEHRLRAFERHLSYYEHIFRSARSVQDALRDYALIERRVADRSDTFLLQLLTILRVLALDFCVAVDWRHNPGMAYLDIKVEERCLKIRGLLMRWVSRQRVRTGDMAFVRADGALSSISKDAVRTLRIGEYQELRIERRVMVVAHSGDEKLIEQIDKALSSLIVELKAIMAY